MCDSDLPMPVSGGAVILVDCGAIGTPAVGFIPVAAAAGVESTLT